MKSKSREQSTVSSRTPHNSEEYSYYRLCHFCLHLNESVSDIADCEKCKRHLTLEPLLRRMVNENGITIDGMDEAWEEEEKVSEERQEARDYAEALFYRNTAAGLIGLSVFW